MNITRVGSTCNGVDKNPGSPGGGKIHRLAQTLEYRAYRRYWNCYGGDIGRTAEVASFGSLNYDQHGSNTRVAYPTQKVGYPTQRNVFVTLEFIDPTTSVCSNTGGYCDDADLDSSLISANCATDGSNIFNSVPRPSSWPLDTSSNVVKWEIDPSLPGDRKIQADTAWCYPLVPCWNDAGELLQTVGPPAAPALAEKTEPGGCEDPVPAACQGFHRPILSLGGSCNETAAADFALEQGCVAPGTTADRLRGLATPTHPDELLPPGWGVLTSGHYRWANPIHGGVFSTNGAQTELHASTDRTADDPGLPLFAVAAGLAVDALWEFCQGADMTVVGVWPTYPSSEPVDKFPHWPAGACDGSVRTPPYKNPVYEIDGACTDSYPRLYDNEPEQSGIQLHGRWKQCLEGPPGLQPESPGCAEMVPGCVGEDECADWVIPQPGFYRVRVLVDVAPVLKNGHAKTVADAAKSDLAAAPFAPRELLVALNAAVGTVVATDLGSDGATQQSAAKRLAEQYWGPSDGDPATVEDPEPFVFDQVIWAQSFFTGST